MSSYIQRPDGDYTATPNQLIYDVRFNKMPSGDKSKIMLIYSYAKPANWSYHSSHIAEEMGISESTVDRAIATAKDLGWLETKAEKKPVDVDGITHWVSSSYWEVVIPEEAQKHYEELKRKWADKKRTYSENTPKASKMTLGISKDDALKKTYSNNTKDLTLPPNGESAEPKEKAEFETGVLQAPTFADAWKLAREARKQNLLSLSESNALLSKKLQGILEASDGSEESPSPQGARLPSPTEFIKWPRFAWVLSDLPNRSRHRWSTKLLALWTALKEDHDGTLYGDTGYEVTKARGIYKTMLEKYPHEQSLMALLSAARSEEFSYLVSAPQSLPRLTEKFSARYVALEKEIEAEKRRKELTEKRRSFALFEDDAGEVDEEMLEALTGGK